mmetsp:Transcript_5873/g.14317  ORF Transcript_5873/g.14317 Transcript_5873/m.14317 type:complete len:237 (+) Transcript_5873:47-757(+)
MSFCAGGEGWREEIQSNVKMSVPVGPPHRRRISHPRSKMLFRACPHLCAHPVQAPRRRRNQRHQHPRRHCEPPHRDQIPQPVPSCNPIRGGHPKRLAPLRPVIIHGHRRHHRHRHRHHRKHHRHPQGPRIRALRVDHLPRARPRGIVPRKVPQRRRDQQPHLRVLHPRAPHRGVGLRETEAREQHEGEGDDEGEPDGGPPDEIDSEEVDGGAEREHGEGEGVANESVHRDESRDVL